MVRSTGRHSWATNLDETTRLPQGFKNSPTIFDEEEDEDLGDYRIQHPRGSLLQYVDDLLLATESQQTCLEATRDLLYTLGELG